MTKDNFYCQYLLHHADNLIILSQRTSEWCGHSPNVELDIAITNIALDMLGQARNFYQLCCQQLNDNSTEDSLAYLRHADEFLNSNLVEIPNKDFALTIARLFFVSNYYYHHYELIVKNSNNLELKGLASKHLKETTYHVRWCKDWLLRFYFGTNESKQKLIDACNELAHYTTDFLSKFWFDDDMKGAFNIDSDTILENTVQAYTNSFEQKEQVFLNLISKEGLTTQILEKTVHTAHLSTLLNEMQSVHREHPNAIW